MANAVDNLFYMAASDDRQLEVRALDIPMLLVERTPGMWMRQRAAAGMRLEFGGLAARHCHGSRRLEAASGSLQTTPVGKDYCVKQECGWLIRVPSDDIVVLSFGRFALECGINATSGAPLW